MNISKSAQSDPAAADSPGQNIAHSPKAMAQSGTMAAGIETGDAGYFQNRAEQELDLAQRGTNSAVVAAHYSMAERYLELVRRLQEETPSKVIDEQGTVAP